MFRRAGCSLLRAESISCSLDVLFGGLVISKLQFWIKKLYFMETIFSYYRSKIRTLLFWQFSPFQVQTYLGCLFNRNLPLLPLNCIFSSSG